MHTPANSTGVDCDEESNIKNTSSNTRFRHSLSADPTHINAVINNQIDDERIVFLKQMKIYDTWKIDARKKNR
jgi:hypothetical protein